MLITIASKNSINVLHQCRAAAHLPLCSAAALIIISGAQHSAMPDNFDR
jgi:hypothetical protein